VAHRDGEPAGIAQLFLELGLPHARPAAVRATRIGQDEQTLGLREAAAPVVGPPVTNRLDGKAWRVETVADAHKAAIVGQVINTVRDRLADGILRPVMRQHRLGRPAPGPPSVLEVADQLLFFRIHADDGFASRLKLFALFGGVPELGLALRRRAARLGAPGVELGLSLRSSENGLEFRRHTSSLRARIVRGAKAQALRRALSAA